MFFPKEQEMKNRNPCFCFLMEKRSPSTCLGEKKEQRHHTFTDARSLPSHRHQALQSGSTSQEVAHLFTCAPSPPQRLTHHHLPLRKLIKLTKQVQHPVERVLLDSFPPPFSLRETDTTVAIRRRLWCESVFGENPRVQYDLLKAY